MCQYHNLHGDKRSYPSWKAAFYTCVDAAPATPEYKLLQLRHYLRGDALKVVESLGYSAVAYEAAKERLERKYGGNRRRVAIDLEVLDLLKTIRAGVAADVEKLADLLDVININMKEAGRHEELGNGTLYVKVQKKLTEAMLTNYYRWVSDSQKIDAVGSLREWLLREAEFQTIASETINGMGNRRKEWKVEYSHDENSSLNNPTRSEDKSQNRCEVCNEVHPLWNCEKFEAMDVKARWKIAKSRRLCYRFSDHITLQKPGHDPASVGLMDAVIHTIVYFISHQSLPGMEQLLRGRSL